MELTKSATTEFVIDGTAYEVDRFGVVHEVGGKVTQQYDREYVASRYDSIPETVRQMSFLRAGWVSGVTKIQPGARILDIGYGNGDFLRVMRWLGYECFGYDISGYPVPENCGQLELPNVLADRFDLVALFDSLEHCISLDFLAEIKTRYLVVTAPYFPGIEHFREWRHRRPGEHLWAFTPQSLAKLLARWEFKQIASASIEDAIRRPDTTNPNTFTSIFFSAVADCGH